MSWGVMSWTGKSDVYQQPRADLSLPALCCSIGAAPRVAVPCSLLLHTPITRRADHASRRRSARRSPRPRSSRGRNARRAGPNAAGVLVILSKHTIYIRFHLSLRQRNYEQVRLVHLIVVAVPLPQIQEQIVEVIKVIPQERIQQRTLEETVKVLVLQIQEQIVAVVKALFQCRTRFVFLSHSRSAHQIMTLSQDHHPMCVHMYSV